MDKRNLIPPTDEEHAAITRGVASDPDTVEWTNDAFAAARPVAEVCPEVVARHMRRRGPQKAPTRESISLRVDQDVLERWRATGPGWQSRINETLRRAVE